jgi:hypothetical protein
MSGVSGISSPLLASLLNGQQSNLLKPANGQAQNSGPANITDIVSLLGNSTASNDSLYGLLSGIQGSGSSDATYNLLLAGANAQLMKENPTLVQAILSAEQSQAQTTGGEASTDSAPSQTTGDEVVQDLQNINLFAMSPDALASMLQRYLESRNAAVQATSGSQVNQTV